MMSEKQVVANRRNAKKSTGPTSAGGKQASSGNATKHGLTAESHMLLPGESLEDLQKLRSRLVADLAPQGVFEEEIADRIVDLMWRLRRGVQIETGVLAYAYYAQVCKQIEEELKDIREPPLVNPMAIQKDIGKGEQKLRKAIADREETVPFVGRAFIEDTKTHDALAKLSRYETGLWNQLVKARRELRELQARRVNAEFSVANEN